MKSQDSVRRGERYIW